MEGAGCNARLNAASVAESGCVPAADAGILNRAGGAVNHGDARVVVVAADDSQDRKTGNDAMLC